MEQQGLELSQSHRYSFHLPHIRSITIRNVGHSKLQFTLKKVSDKKGLNSMSFSKTWETRDSPSISSILCLSHVISTIKMQRIKRSLRTKMKSYIEVQTGKKNKVWMKKKFTYQCEKWLPTPHRVMKVWQAGSIWLITQSIHCSRSSTHMISTCKLMTHNRVQIVRLTRCLRRIWERARHLNW